MAARSSAESAISRFSGSVSTGVINVGHSLTTSFSAGSGSGKSRGVDGGEIEIVCRFGLFVVAEAPARAAA